MNGKRDQKHPKCYWTDKTIVDHIKAIVKDIGHFPTQTELKKLKRCDLQRAVARNGGLSKFREILGYSFNQKPPNYWTDKTIIKELQVMINQINHFPTQPELIKLSRYNLMMAIGRHGGSNKFRKLLGYNLLKKPNGFWTDETILYELNLIIKNINHFPTEKELHLMKKDRLIYAITQNGGINKFRRLSKNDVVRVSSGFWTDKTITEELSLIIKNIGHFPTPKELRKMGKCNLVHAIVLHDGFNKYRESLGYDLIKKPNGYWTEKVIVKELKEIVSKLGYFPNRKELERINKIDLLTAIFKHGGYPKFREIMGYPNSIYQKYRSELSSYNLRRGKNSEKLVKKILIDYCLLHNLPSTSYNVNLSKGNVIEFVCNTGKRIGVDVTNTERKSNVYHKWIHKDYHKYLDELWIVVFCDIFTEKDYHKWNQDSPPNTKIFSIHQFLEELDYSLDEYTKSKIDKYCKCTFHTKEQFKSTHIINIPRTSASIKYNLCSI